MDTDVSAKSEKYNIRAVERCFAIMDIFAKADGALTVQTVSEELGINSNMAFRMLTTMTKAGYLEKDEKTGLFSVSLKFLPLSRKALMAMEIRRVVIPFFESLRGKYPKANLNLAVFSQNEVVVVDRIDSMSLPLTYCVPGKSLPFHASALGKALTCELPDDELDALIKTKGLTAYTPNTNTTPETLRAALAKVRHDQVSRDRSELIPTHNCNAVPLRDAKGKIIAAMSLAAFETYMSIQEIEDTIPILMETGRNISYFMGYNA